MKQPVLADSHRDHHLLALEQIPPVGTFRSCCLLQPGEQVIDVEISDPAPFWYEWSTGADSALSDSELPTCVRQMVKTQVSVP
jgi:hypothetical protein